MDEIRATNEELAKEAKAWDSGNVKPTDFGWVNAPEAVARFDGSVSLSVQLPHKLVVILHEMAKRADVSIDCLVSRVLTHAIRANRQLSDLVGKCQHD